ncbi:MAG: T9SS type A sorting domain-containing protein [Flavipsychrobacter sp.]|nr:T9SS type A sorting domain-containing protein [Flavipsychrobacter sp.]
MCAAEMQAQPYCFMPTSKRSLNFEKYVRVLLANNPEFDAQLEKTTITKERVIAQADYHYGSIVDSTRFIYKSSNRHGSKFDYGVFEYPTATPYLGLNDFVGIDNVNGYHTGPTVYADTILKYNRRLNNIFLLQEKDFIKYDSTGNYIKEYLTQDTVYGFTKYITNHDSLNNVTDITTLMTHTYNGTLDSAYKRFFKYAQNRVVEDSTMYWGTPPYSNYFYIVYKNEYTYDNASNLILMTLHDYSGPIPDAGQIINTYTSTNQLKRSEIDYSDGSQWIPNSIDSFGYSAGLPYYNYWFDESTGAMYNTISNSLGCIVHYHFSSAGLIDSLYGTIDTGTNITFPFIAIPQYDSYNNPVKIKFYYYYNGTFSTSVERESRYYYEPYTPTSVSNFVAAANAIKIYPNPTRGVLQISGIDKNVNTVNVSLVSMTGQIVVTQVLHCNSQTQTISIGDISPGIYTLTITDDGGQIMHSQKIVKN